MAVINPGKEEVQYSYTVNYKEVKQKSALPQSGNFSYTLQFKKQLDPSLIFMRKPDSAAFSLSKKAGLTLKLKPETIMEMGSPAFVGKRQQHLYNTIETKIDFTAAAANEKAGLAVFQSESHFYFMTKSINNGKEVVQLFKGKPKEKVMEMITEAPLQTTSSKLHLKITAEGDSYSFYYSADGENWNLLKDKVDAKFVSTKTAGGFVGCIYGMYATSSGEQSSNTASFKFLKYSGNDPMYR